MEHLIEANSQQTIKNVSADCLLPGSSPLGDGPLVEQPPRLDSELRLHAIRIPNELTAIHNKDR